METNIRITGLNTKTETKQQGEKIMIAQKAL